MSGIKTRSNISGFSQDGDQDHFSTARDPGRVLADGLRLPARAGRRRRVPPLEERHRRRLLLLGGLYVRARDAEGEGAEVRVSGTPRSSLGQRRWPLRPFISCQVNTHFPFFQAFFQYSRSIIILRNISTENTGTSRLNTPHPLRRRKLRAADPISQTERLRVVGP